MNATDRALDLVDRATLARWRRLQLVARGARKGARRSAWLRLRDATTALLQGRG